MLKHCKLQLENKEESGSIEERTDESIQCQKDALNSSNDFARIDGNHLEIARYYGVREFLVLVSTKRESVTDETKIRILLSSFAIAATNANWYVRRLGNVVLISIC